MSDDDLVWVFGYASLMWRPGFDVARHRSALLRGRHRALCMYSHVRWGTPEAPGLAMGLLPGGSCRGAALGVPRRREAEVLTYLRGREGAPYRHAVVALETEAGPLAAHAFVPIAGHPMNAGRLTPDQAAPMIHRARGTAGTAHEYLANTVNYLSEIGIMDRALDRLLAAVETHAAEREPGEGDTSDGHKSEPRAASPIAASRD